MGGGYDLGTVRIALAVVGERGDDSQLPLLQNIVIDAAAAIARDDMEPAIP